MYTNYRIKIKKREMCLTTVMTELTKYILIGLLVTAINH